MRLFTTAIYFVLVAAAAVAALPQGSAVSVMDIIKNLKKDSGGTFRLGTDDILRSYSADNQVIDSVQLTPTQADEFNAMVTPKKMAARSAMPEDSMSPIPPSDLERRDDCGLYFCKNNRTCERQGCIYCGAVPGSPLGICI